MIELNISPSELDLDQDLVQKTDQESDQDEGKDQESNSDRYTDLDHICTSLCGFALNIICLDSN